MPLQQTIFDAYAREAVNRADIQPLDEGGFGGRVPGLVGVIAFGDTERDVVLELFSVVEDWARMRRGRDAHVPAIGGVDLHTEEAERLL